MIGMGEVSLIDTSVFLNVLDVPGLNQERENILDEFCNPENLVRDFPGKS